MISIPVKSKIENVRLFKISKMKEIIKPTKPHKHAGYFELIFLSKGSGTHSIDEIVYPVNGPVIFFLKPNQTHCWDFSSFPRGYVLLFKEEIFNNNSIRDLLYKTPPCLGVREYDFIETIFEKLSVITAEIDIVACYINVLIHHILEDTTISDTKIESSFYEFQKMIDHSFKELKLVSDYASNLNMTPKKLSELCKNTTGKTAQDMIKERIFIESKVLLTHSQKSINEIALELNFSDASHFNKFFTANAKITPGLYRKLSNEKNVQ